MSEQEKALRHQQLYSHVKTCTAQSWAASFVKELRSAAAARAADSEHADGRPLLDSEAAVDHYRRASRRLILLDYDGTLTAIRKIPSEALPSPELLDALAALAADPANNIFIVSGRDQAFLEQTLGHIRGLGLSAEHGCFIKYPGAAEWINLADHLDLTWKPKVAEIFNYYTERTPGSFVEHKRASITWHYRLADPSYGAFQANECRNHLEHAVLSKLPVEVMLGKKNLEVRPVAASKGDVARRLLADEPRADFCFCAGDDRTDEDMFRAVARAADRAAAAAASAAGLAAANAAAPAAPLLSPDAALSCTVGPADKPSAAAWRLDSPDRVVRLLAAWAGTRPPAASAAPAAAAEEGAADARL
ncbi:threalose-6-phosphate phosphatase [Cladochytrium tenue]|nr:threalose-6-phosphate phosphatase [Cladochytrium tenue]